MTATEMLARLIDVKDNLGEDAGEIVQLNENEYLNLVKSQLLRGENVEGGKIDPSYANFTPEGHKIPYPETKNRQNPVPGYGTPDLYYTGEMFAAMTVGRSQNSLFIFSDVYYFSDLVFKYDQLGEAPVFGLNEENKDVFRATVLFPLLRNRISLRLSI